MAAKTVSDNAPVPWKEIAREVRFRLQPKQSYYRLIHQRFFGGIPDLQDIDPFDIEVLHTSNNNYHYPRSEVSDTIDRRGSMIIYGKLGSGKTMLFNTREKKDKQLLVRINLPYYRDLAAFQPDDLVDHSPLNTWTLSYLIFNALWQDFFCQTSKEDALKTVREDRSWMETLRWFYHHFPPLPLETAENLPFELEAWLQTDPGKDRLPPSRIRDNILAWLIDFITHEFDGDDELIRFYQRVTVFVDGVDALQAEEQKKFAEDIHHILELRLYNFEIKVFISTSNRELFLPESKYIYYPHNLSFYELPRWSTEELHCLLERRLEGLAPSGNAFFEMTPSGGPPVHLPSIDPDFSMSSEVRATLFDLLIQEAVRCYELKDPCDAPIHLLRLTRGCLAFATGHWSVGSQKLILDRENLQNLFNAYWDI